MILIAKSEGMKMAEFHIDKYTTIPEMENWKSAMELVGYKIEVNREMV